MATKKSTRSNPAARSAKGGNSARKRKASKKKTGSRRKPIVRISPAKYAEHRGCTRPAVLKAIADGRISDAVTVDRRGWKRIDPDLADQLWAANTDPAKTRAGDGSSADDDEHGHGLNGYSDLPVGTPVALCRQEITRIQALRLRARYEREAGEVAPWKDIEAAWVRLGTRLRENLFGMVDRWDAELTASTEIENTRRILIGAIEGALRGMKKTPRGMPKG